MYDLAVADSPYLSDESRLVGRFLAWLPRACARDRADAVNALARAYLHGGLAQDTRAQAEYAMTTLLDDPEPSVRRALAEALASGREAPRHIILALANDHSDISRVVLALSPLFSEADLVDAAVTGDAVAQTAIARRAQLSPAVVAALADVGDRAAALTMIGNPEVGVPRSALWRIFDRFRDDAEVRARLAVRAGLPSPLRAAIATATTAALAAFAASAAHIDIRRTERMARDGREQAFVAIAADCSQLELSELVHWLRSNHHLTVSLLLRALAGGDERLFRQSLANMSSLTLRRIEGLLRDPRGRGFAAAFRKAGMPARFLPAFRVAAEMAAKTQSVSPVVDYSLTMKILQALEERQDPALAPIVATLWRLASEGAREDARNVAADPGTIAEIESLEIAAHERSRPAPAVLMLSFEPGNENQAPPIEFDRASVALPAAA